MTINVPLQVELARQNLNHMVVGGVDGTVCVYDHATSELVNCLRHKVKGCVQVIDVGIPMFQHPSVSNKFLGGKQT